MHPPLLASTSSIAVDPSSRVLIKQAIMSLLHLAIVFILLSPPTAGQMGYPLPRVFASTANLEELLQLYSTDNDYFDPVGAGQDVTFLAPSNDAFREFTSGDGKACAHMRAS